MRVLSFLIMFLAALLTFPPLFAQKPPTDAELKSTAISLFTDACLTHKSDLGKWADAQGFLKNEIGRAVPFGDSLYHPLDHIKPVNMWWVTGMSIALVQFQNEGCAVAAHPYFNDKDTHRLMKAAAAVTIPEGKKPPFYTFNDDKNPEKGLSLYVMNLNLGELGLKDYVFVKAYRLAKPSELKTIIYYGRSPLIFTP